MASLQLEHVRKAYPNGFVAVEDATFDVADGERLVLVGPSGCGKSTLLRMIARPAHRTRRLRCAGRLARPADHRRHPARRIRVAGQGASGFDAEVEVVEPVGSDVFVNLRLGSQALVARFGPETHRPSVPG